MTPQSSIISTIGGDDSSFITANDALANARKRDPFGHQLHTVLAMAYLFLLPIESAPGNIAFGLLLAWTGCRLLHTWRTYRFVYQSPVVLAWLAWAAWEAASLLWSSDVHKGLGELGTCRVLLLPFMLWPVLDRLPWLLCALLLGVLCQNGAQFMQSIGWMSPRQHDPADRYAGFTHAIKTAAWCCAAMCWSLSAMLRAAGWKRWASMALLVAASTGLVLSGSRGPWVAAAISVPLMLLVMLVRRPRVRRFAGIVMMVGIVGSSVAWRVARHAITPRIDSAISEYQKARDDHVYWTSVGLRVGMWRWSGGIFRKHAVFGAGAGGFNAAKAEQPDFKDAMNRAHSESQRKWLTKDHPHSMLLYALTCTGIIGTSILFTAMALTFRQAWKDRPDHVFVDGSVFVLLTWLIGAQSDTYNLAGQLLGMIGVVVAITLPHRAVVRLTITAKGDDVG